MTSPDLCDASWWPQFFPMPDPACRLPLWGWYAVPLPEEQARGWLRERQQAQRRGRQPGGLDILGRVQDMVARASLGLPIHLQYLGMAAAARDGYERALAELIYGQLLLSRRVSGAPAHLDAGLRYARDILATGAYFLLVKRHELLAHLPLGDTPRAPQDLAALLAEATVIKRLRAGERPRRGGGIADTVG